MPDGSPSEQSILNRSQTVNTRASRNNASESSRRSSSSISLQSRRPSGSSIGESKPPLTPEESPPYLNPRKRSAGAVEEADQVPDAPETSPTHTRTSSGESAAHICICQPDPKIPRPRNAFILYRQHHQAQVVARNPGLANPEISKIIGEQWQNESTEQKNEWKALAEEEKLRHQQQYPNYRYQPKRNARRNSIDGTGSSNEKSKCPKCSGRVILTPSAPYSNSVQNSSFPATPSSAITPLGRTLPILRDLSLESPVARHTRGSYPGNNMPRNHRYHEESRDELGPLSPENKRRRFNGDQPATAQRMLPPRYGGVAPNVIVGPKTPFPFGQPPPAHAFPPPTLSPRRESLPGIRGIVSPPGQMAPPPRPGMGYHQHRLSQGHMPHDRSLTLPPLQTGRAEEIARAATSAKKMDEQVMNISFRYKIRVLNQVAPPGHISKEEPRGPLIAIEGDNVDAVVELASWLTARLSKGEDLHINLMEGPHVYHVEGKEEAMAQYHRLAAEWLEKNRYILDSIRVKSRRQTMDTPMGDVALTSPQPIGKAEESYESNEADEIPRTSIKVVEQKDENTDTSAPARTNSSVSETVTAEEKMDVDKRKSADSLSALAATSSHATKPITLIPNYSLHASNFFARTIPIGPNDPYAPSDHWQWTATLWRGIIGPDLTIYLRDVPGSSQSPPNTAGNAGTNGGSGSIAAGPAAPLSGPSVEMEGLDGRSDVALFVIRRTITDSEGNTSAEEHGSGVEASVLRRVGFEVSEWVRAFGASARKE